MELSGPPLQPELPADIPLRNSASWDVTSKSTATIQLQ